jgi:hypothetical protein
VRHSENIFWELINIFYEKHFESETEIFPGNAYMLAAIILWQAVKDDEPSPVDYANAYLVTELGVTNMDVSSRHCPDNAAALIPQSINGQGIAVFLVPDALTGRITRDGQFLAPGAHILRHGDEIRWNALRLWIAKNDRIEETNYDPNKHGENMFCARTRSRLISGEPVIICPGTLSNSCGMIFKASAWLNMRCHICGFEPNQASWTPPQKKRGVIDELLRLAER